MIRLMLCASLCACTLMSSNELYRQKRKEAESAFMLADAAAVMTSMISYRAEDVYTLARCAFEDMDIPGAEAFSKIEGGDFPALWKAACRGLKADSVSKKLLEGIGSFLGSCDASSQADRLRVVENSLRARGAELMKRLSETKKLYAALGILSGLGVSVMII